MVVRWLRCLVSMVTEGVARGSLLFGFAAICFGSPETTAGVAQGPPGLPAFTDEHWTVTNLLGSGSENFRRFSLRSEIAFESHRRLSKIFSDTKYPVQTIRKVFIFVEQDGNSEMGSDSALYVYLRNSDEQILEQLSERPRQEPALAATYRHHLEFLQRTLGEDFAHLMLEHCFEGSVSAQHSQHEPYGPYLPLDADYNSWRYSFVDTVGHATVSLLKKSCLIKEARIFDRRGVIETDGALLMDRRLRPVIYTNNPRPLSLTQICASGECGEAREDSERTRIGVIDSGIDYNSKYLVNSLIPSSNPYFPYLGVDLLDRDWVPYDVIYPGQWLYYLYNIRSLVETFQPSHGSGVAYRIVHGSPELSVIPVRVIDNDTIFADEIRNPLVNVGYAIDYVVQNGAACVNISIKFPYHIEGHTSGEVRSLLASAVRRHPDTLFIFAAGNGGANLERREIVDKYGPDSIYTRDLPNVLLVGSVNERRSFSSFSNHGPSIVHLAAPGENISVPRAEGRWARVSGTSYSAPLVTKTCGKIRHHRRSLSATEVKALLLETADRHSHLEDYFGAGRVLNEDAAIRKMRELADGQ